MFYFATSDPDLRRWQLGKIDCDDHLRWLDSSEKLTPILKHSAAIGGIAATIHLLALARWLFSLFCQLAG